MSIVTLMCIMNIQKKKKLRKLVPTVVKCVKVDNKNEEERQDSSDHNDMDMDIDIGSEMENEDEV